MKTLLCLVLLLRVEEIFSPSSEEKIEDLNPIEHAYLDWLEIENNWFQYMNVTSVQQAIDLLREGKLEWTLLKGKLDQDQLLALLNKTLEIAVGKEALKAKNVIESQETEIAKLTEDDKSMMKKLLSGKQIPLTPEEYDVYIEKARAGEFEGTSNDAWKIDILIMLLEKGKKALIAEYPDLAKEYFTKLQEKQGLQLGLEYSDEIEESGEMDEVQERLWGELVQSEDFINMKNLNKAGYMCPKEPTEWRNLIMSLQYDKLINLPIEDSLRLRLYVYTQYNDYMKYAIEAASSLEILENIEERIMYLCEVYELAREE